ncbi:hypothetical protein VF04_03900 [Nostoc linckia z7]|uniref:Uncharacterized protein n=2 Tax=Nostoc linckia TaxID=92942 RepID=A0A9Q6ENC0_NOSLI|nr:hypothetical protein [Nostoc linckia]PHK42999.1 hypothetical protein VF12_01365 [Nostoc linckia z15]PHK48156.1 hypothetical protein VF13_02340 [Nostoc linckia z16]PHJ64940.1 hypothetical protein VF02_11390 [Nostoc linckia z1]PHJ70117.1 hypothetical protein VF05_11545 [Nostoc linckia z3]PHJ75018.1 hypothetical protein VF03_11705 [Nostoc linckia z2]
MRSQYASTITPPPPTVNVVSGSTTEASAGNKSIWIYCRNRAGITLFSLRTDVTIASNQGVEITLPSAIRKTASDIHEIGIVMSNDTVPENGCVVATYLGYEIDGTPTNLPATITLFRDTHFELRTVVANPTALPNSYRINGMRRLINSTNQIVEWKTRDANWVACLPQNFNPYIASTLTEGGCDIELSKITDTSAIIFPDYDSSGDLSEPVRFWIVNDTNFEIPQGKRIRLSVATDDEDVGADDFKGLLQLAFLGYVNTTTGALDTTDMVVSSGTFTYQGDKVTNLALPKPLLPNYGYVLQVQMAFDDADVGNSIAQGAIVKIYPRLAPNFSEYDPVADLLGNYIVATDERRRILPNGSGLDLVAGVGSGSIAFYKFRKLGKQLVPGLEANASDQKVIITNNGTCFVANSVPEETAALRALVSTVDGVGQISDWSTASALTNALLLRIVLMHPTTIRDDYPDVIAGMVAQLNATKVRVYVRPVGGGTIQVFDIPIVGEDGEEILVGSLVSSTASNLPTVPSNVGLFNIEGFVGSTVSGSSVFSTGNYQFCIAYLNINTVTSISHASPPCVYEREHGLEPPNIEVNPEVTILEPGSPASVTNTGIGGNAYLTFSLPLPDVSALNFDNILTDSNGSVLVDSNGNVLQA